MILGMEDQRRAALLQKAATVSLIATTSVVAIKLLAAWKSGSIAVLAEGLQSLLDIFIACVTLFTIRIASRPPDLTHPHGHGKAEVISSAFQMMLIVLTAGAISWKAVERLYAPRAIEVDWGLAAMAISLVVNFLVMSYVKRVGKAERSSALIGEAEHLRSDSLASLGVLIGLVAYALTGWPILDPLVAIVFTLFGAFFAIKHLGNLVHELMDGALPERDVQAIAEMLEGHPEVRGYHKIFTRRSGPLRIVSLHVMLDDALTFVAAHDLAEEVEQEISQALDGAHVTVHFEPYEAELAHQDREHSASPIL